MSDAYLHLKNVVKSYDGRINAVDGISIDVRRGEFLTLLGPSGSGKTTTLMMIAGFEDMTAGTLELDGHSLADVKPYRRNIGMVFQNYALFPHMTNARNVAFPLKMRKFPKEEIESRVDKALALVGLSAFADKFPREISGGQQRAVLSLNPMFCCSMSRWARSIKICANRCRSKFAGYIGKSGSRRFT